MNRNSTFARRAASMIALGALTLGPVLVGGAAASAATGNDVQLALSGDSDLADGQKITVDGAGLDPELGYYLSTCVVGTSGPTGPECAGGPNDVATSKWVSNSPGATVPISPDGRFTTKFRVARAGETMRSGTIDCDETPCAVTLFGDHKNGFVPTADRPITFGATGVATASSALDLNEDPEVGQVAAESNSDGGVNSAWWIVVGGVVVALAGGGIVYRRRS